MRNDGLVRLSPPRSGTRRTADSPYKGVCDQSADAHVALDAAAGALREASAAGGPDAEKMAAAAAIVGRLLACLRTPDSDAGQELSEWAASIASDAVRARTKALQRLANECCRIIEVDGWLRAAAVIHRELPDRVLGLRAVPLRDLLSKLHPVARQAVATAKHSEADLHLESCRTFQLASQLQLRTRGGDLESIWDVARKILRESLICCGAPEDAVRRGWLASLKPPPKYAGTMDNAR